MSFHIDFKWIVLGAGYAISVKSHLVMLASYLEHLNAIKGNYF